MDGMSIDAFPEFARYHWERLRSALEEGTYRPAAELRVMMPKATGGQRPLGLPTVVDRVIQHAIAQVIGPLFEPHFSTHSYGFRPGRRASMALAEMEEAHREGLRYAVDGDLQRFFDAELPQTSNGTNEPRSAAVLPSAAVDGSAQTGKGASYADSCFPTRCHSSDV